MSILQFRIWLHDVSPMVWRRFQVPSTMTPREFHGVLQVAMGWEGIHLYQFVIHGAVRLVGGRCPLSGCHTWQFATA
ncbi:hypothetical protein [Mesorhizobium sp. M0910]|uniref:IS1096 element passenger TnpR family protein n=1 Tax=Mesorhizobium sp. M0910 TaxID=2957025 RepID=UPI0033367E5A